MLKSDKTSNASHLNNKTSVLPDFDKLLLSWVLAARRSGSPGELGTPQDESRSKQNILFIFPDKYKYNKNTLFKLSRETIRSQIKEKRSRHPSPPLSYLDSWG